VRPTRAAAILILAGLAACAGPAERCARVGGQPAWVAELYFGRSVAGRAAVNEAEWRAFADGVIAREFPDGFTVLDGHGRWRDPATGRAVGEDTKVVVVSVPRAQPIAAKLDAVSEAYKRQYAQQSVGRVVRRACSSF
jgi:hypothetical protein